MAETITDPLAREVMRELADADGPLTAREVANLVASRHHGAMPLAPVAHALTELVRAGRVETRADAGLGITARASRMYWPAR